jgi:hypothetical protein
MYAGDTFNISILSDLPNTPLIQSFAQNIEKNSQLSPALNKENVNNFAWRSTPVSVIYDDDDNYSVNFKEEDMKEDETAEKDVIRDQYGGSYRDGVSPSVDGTKESSYPTLEPPHLGGSNEWYSRAVLKRFFDRYGRMKVAHPDKKITQGSFINDYNTLYPYETEDGEQIYQNRGITSQTSFSIEHTRYVILRIILINIFIFILMLSCKVSTRITRFMAWF